MTEPIRDVDALKAFNANIVDQFRANAGKVGDQFEGTDLLLLTTTGAKSGNRRLNPLQYVRSRRAMIIVGAYAGADVDPGMGAQLARQSTIACRSRHRFLRCHRSRITTRGTESRVGPDHRRRTGFRRIPGKDQPGTTHLRVAAGVIPQCGP